jgi:hypothetical protein
VYAAVLTSLVQYHIATSSSTDTCKYIAWLHCLQDPFISDVLHTAMNVYKDGLRLYGPDRLFTSYNGGKDAVVVMQVSYSTNQQYIDHHVVFAASISVTVC